MFVNEIKLGKSFWSFFKLSKKYQGETSLLQLSNISLTSLAKCSGLQMLGSETESWTTKSPQESTTQDNSGDSNNSQIELWALLFAF